MKPYEQERVDALAQTGIDYCTYAGGEVVDVGDVFEFGAESSRYISLAIVNEPNNIEDGWPVTIFGPRDPSFSRLVRRHGERDSSQETP